MINYRMIVVPAVVLALTLAGAAWAEKSCCPSATVKTVAQATAAEKAPAKQPPLEKGFVRLFDGKTFKGWKISTENPKTFTIKDGAIIAKGNRAHLFYAGDVCKANFKNFELKIDLMTAKNSNGGVYFHTKYQKGGWPSKGFEVQVNNTHRDRKKTGGLYAVKDVMDKSPATDGVWFTEHIIVKGKTITIKVTPAPGAKPVTTVEFTEPTPPAPPGGMKGRVLSSGTFALQGHDPKSVVHYKNIRVKVLPD